MPAIATTIYKVRAIEGFEAKTKEQVSFSRNQAFYVLAANTDTGFYFVSTQYATPFSRTSVSGLVPIKNFEIVDLMSKDPPSVKSNVAVKQDKERERVQREREQKERERQENERLRKAREGEVKIPEKRIVDSNRWVPEDDNVSPLREDEESPKDTGFRRKGSLLAVAAANNSKTDPMSTNQSRFPRPFGAPRAPSEEDLRRKFNSQIEFRKHPDSAKRNYDPRQSVSSTTSNASSNSSTRSKGNSMSVRSSINSMNSRNSLQDNERTRRLLEEHNRQLSKMRYQMQFGEEAMNSLERTYGLRPNERPFFNPPPLLRGKIDIVAWDMLVNDQIVEIFVLGMLERTNQHPPRFQMQVTRQKHTHIVARTFGEIYCLHGNLVGEFNKPAERNFIPTLPESLTGGISEMRNSQDFDTKLFQHEKEMSAYISKLNSLPLYILDSFFIIRFFAPTNFSEMEITGKGSRRNSFSKRDSYSGPNFNTLRKQRPLSRSSSTSSLNFDSKIGGNLSIQRTLGASNLSRRSSMMFDQSRYQNIPQTLTTTQKRLNSAGDAEEEVLTPSNTNSMYVNHGSMYQPLGNGRYNQGLSRRSSTNFNIEIYKSKPNSNSPSPPRESESGTGVSRGLGAPAPPPDSSPTDSLLSPAPILSPPPSARRFSRQSVYQPKERSFIPRTNYQTQSKGRINGNDSPENMYNKRDSSYGRGDVNLSSSQSIRRVLAGRIAAAAAAKQAAEALIGSTNVQGDIDVPGSTKFTNSSLPPRRGSGDESFSSDEYKMQDKGLLKIGNYPSNSLPSSFKNVTSLAREQANAIRRRSSSGGDLSNFQMNTAYVKEALVAKQQQAAAVSQRAASVQRERERERERDRLAALARQQALAQEAQMQRYNNQQSDFKARQISTPDRRSITPDRLPSSYRSPPSPNMKNAPQVKPFVAATLSRSTSTSAIKASEDMFSSPSKSIENDGLARNGSISRIPAPNPTRNQDFGSKGRNNNNNNGGVSASTPAFQRVTDFGTRGSSLQSRTQTQKLPPPNKASKA